MANPFPVVRKKGDTFDLTGEQGDTFVREYVKDFNPEAAFARAFPERANSARVMGARIIARNPWIQERIKQASAGRITLADLTRERVLLEIGKLALSDVRKTVRTQVNPDGTLSEVPIPLAMLDADTAAAIKEVSYDEHGNRKLKTHPKETALHLLAKVQGLIETPQGRAGVAGKGTNHDATDEEEIMRLLAEAEDAEDIDEVIDMGDDFEGDE